MRPEVMVSVEHWAGLSVDTRQSALVLLLYESSLKVIFGWALCGFGLQVYNCCCRLQFSSNPADFTGFSLVYKWVCICCMCIVSVWVQFDEVAASNKTCCRCC